MCASASRLPARSSAVTVVPIPASSGSSPTRPSSSRWAGPDRPRQRCVRASSAPCDSSSRAASSPIASEEATSPPACPPMPSAIDQQVRPGVAGVLVVRAHQADVGASRVAQRDRHAATSAARARYGRSGPAHPADRDGHADLGAARGRCRWWSRDPRRASAVRRREPGVPARGVVVVEHQRALRCPADQDRGLPQGDAWCPSGNRPSPPGSAGRPHLEARPVRRSPERRSPTLPAWASGPAAACRVASPAWSPGCRTGRCAARPRSPAPAPTARQVPQPKQGQGQLAHRTGAVTPAGPIDDRGCGRRDHGAVGQLGHRIRSPLT